ncbi:Tripartite-type tricarboxylate transporter, receptor component TctC [Variovorax sp. HW608]|uniref:Bug family tripartite tricarboxylate transporter substrate binding protein n=1 Tax=Variovorax sp. HW608 TaxID=1034889 RepID=UPI00081F829D|nr:tripartite tricarboxylate transporter substrate binding protein [Variovorax sp. HW608]SCK26257.1 Tripartite-type tricarboxylate transporter, receptor component TctC [Variovorax sp. HW608]
MQFNLTRRSLLATAIAGFAAGAVHAEDKPPVRFIVPASAGSGIDMQLRSVAPQMTKALGQPLVVENIAGAGGIPGTQQIVRAAPDGNTLGWVSNNHAVNPSVFKKMPFDSLKDITPICVIGATPFVLVVNPKVPAKSVKELQAMLKAKPGKYNFASSGNGTIIHLAAAQLLDELGVEARHIPYKGMAPMVTDIIAGVVEFGIISVPVAQPYVQSGALRPLAVATRQRVASMPDVPTYAEQGFPNVDINGWFAVIGPAKMKPADVNRIHDAVVTAFNTPEAKQAMAEQQNVIRPMSVADSRSYFETEINRYAGLVKKAGVQLD